VLREVVALQCGSLLPRSFSESLLPGATRASSSRKSGTKLPHSKGLRASAIFRPKSRKMPVWQSNDRAEGAVRLSSRG